MMVCATLERARLALPGMVAALLLASPALADDSAGAAGPRPAVATHQARQPVPRSRVRWRRHAAAPEPAGLAADATQWSAPYDSGAAADATRAGMGAAQVGMASWYGGARWHGGMTSSGERFDQDALTAAHATLPLGTLVRVSTLNGSGSVVVRITDRPGTRRRVIDLSRGAASALGMLDRGIAMVSLQPL